MERDRMGRRRHPEQVRGLRPLHPPLPEEWTSEHCGSRCPRPTGRGSSRWLGRSPRRRPTQARAYGLALSALMHSANLPHPEPGPLDWMDWERRKTLRLLVAGR